MLFDVKDEYAQSECKFTFSQEPNCKSHVFNETFPKIKLNEIIPEIDEESDSAGSDIC